MAIHGFIYQGVKYSAIGAATLSGGLVGGAAVAAGFSAMDSRLGRQQGPLNGSSTATEGSMFPEGENIEILSQSQARALGITNGHRRRRRRKLLTCGDKADIAFLHGNLGGGQLGRSAISAVLSRRCS